MKRTLAIWRALFRRRVYLVCIGVWIGDLPLTRREHGRITGIFAIDRYARLSNTTPIRAHIVKTFYVE